MTRLEKPQKETRVGRTIAATKPTSVPRGDVAANELKNGKLGVLATKLRWLRTKAQLTLQELSHLSGISQSALSKIENGQLSPTYEKIVSLAHGLNVDVAELFSRSSAGAASGRRGITRKGDGVVHVTPQYDYEVLCTDLSGKQFMPILTTVKAHSVQDFPTLPRHEGEEFVFIVHGEIVLHSEFYEPIKLRTGDSCYFDSTMGHALVSAGAQNATVLWVCSKNVTMDSK